MYINNTGSILSYLGYMFNDFELSNDGVNVTLNWYHADTMPTEQEILDAELPCMKALAIEQIKQASAKQRLKYVTKDKDAIYAFKQASLVKYQADQTIDLWLQAEMDGTGQTADEVIAIWLARSTMWQTVGATIEKAELAGLKLIAAETDADQCEVHSSNAIAVIELV